MSICRYFDVSLFRDVVMSIFHFNLPSLGEGQGVGYFCLLASSRKKMKSSSVNPHSDEPP